MDQNELKKLRGELLHLTADLEVAIEHYSEKYVRYLEREVETVVNLIKHKQRMIRWEREDAMKFWDKQMKHNEQ